MKLDQTSILKTEKRIIAREKRRIRLAKAFVAAFSHFSSIMLAERFDDIERTSSRSQPIERKFFVASSWIRLVFLRHKREL